MKRIITEKLVAWKADPLRKPLLIRGARQVGKTYSVLEFAKNHFAGNIHVINFEKHPELHSIFNLNLNSNRILGELELVLSKRIISGEDLLFFDEIQECPKAIMALRYFYEENPELHLIAAGSLLEFALHSISFPVGRLQMLSMHPMTFEEFLIAMGKELLADKLKSSNTTLPDTLIKMVNNEMYNYFIIGGMPECVNAFIRKNSFIEAINIQSDLITAFRQDFSKYAGHSDRRCLNMVLTSVAHKTGEQIKYSTLAEGYSNPTIKKAFELLGTARLFSVVRSASPAGVPLGIGVTNNRFKTVFLDIGLLSNIYGFYSDKLVSKQKLTSVFNGKLAEQFVGQEILASQSGDLFYWSRDTRGSSAEVDYLIERSGEVIPVEVKSGKSGSLKSLHLLLNSFTNIKKSYVLTEDKYGELPEQKTEFLPLFKAGSI